jgi:hypothetical protein
LNTALLARHELTVRNRREALAIFVIDDVGALAEDGSFSPSRTAGIGGSSA